MDRTLKLLVIDVDGTMTDGGIYYDENGNEWKKFCTKDAAGFFAARQVGIKIMVLTGRKCKATTRRMQELKVDYIYQDIHNKVEFLREFMEAHNIAKDELGYIGDDLNDLPSMSFAGFVACPSDACAEVKAVSDYISTKRGGYGAVRDCIEHLLRLSGEWAEAIEVVYSIGI